jgi:zinc transporter ZupT
MNQRGQTSIKMALGIAATYGLVGVAAADAVQSVDPQHLLNEQALLQYLLVALAGGILFFLKRLLTEHHEQDVRLNKLEREVHAISVVCNLQHGLPLRKPPQHDSRDE